VLEDRFSSWHRWQDRENLDDLTCPGVYAIAHHPDLGGSPFSWRDDIVYIGMTNSALGLRGRLKQFDNTIVGKTGHGGADRVRYKHRDYAALCKALQVAVAAFNCNVSSIVPADLLIMGEVARFEYVCFAHFVERFGRLPEFNNKKMAPKYSLAVGRALT
jgi:hypothetical protein